MNSSGGLVDKIRQSSWFRSSLFRFGMPFFITMVGGSFWLRDFTQLRYSFRKNRHATREEFEKIMGVPMKKEKVDPEKMLEEINKNLEDDYEIVRGPRPWEDSKGLQKDKVEAEKKAKQPL